MQTGNRYLALLIGIVVVKAIIMVWIILNGQIGLGPDEAQYWTWSQQLDWGYYSKPPGIAWQIWIGTQFFGNTELGVRSASVLLGALLPFSIYYLARTCLLRQATACLAGAIMALSPIGFMGSFLAISDVGMMLFWTLSCATFASALSREKIPNYYLIGFFIMCGAIFKWPIYLLWLLVIGFVLLYRKFASKHLIGGVLLSLVGLFPSMIWNISHEWATFRHVSATIIDKEAGLKSASLFNGNFFGFLGAQVALVSPVLFILLILAFISILRRREQVRSSLLFCGLSSFVIITAFSFLAIFEKIQGNWSDFAYPTGIVLIAWYVNESIPKKVAWAVGGIVLSVAMIVGTLFIPYVQSQALYNQHPISYKINPFKHNLGWDHLSQVLNRAGYDPSQHFLFSSKYQMASILSFYGPRQKRAYFLNLHGIRKNQFSFWPGMAQEQVGKTGFFVLAENSPQLEMQLSQQVVEHQKLLSKYFRDVNYLGIAPLFDSYGMMVKGAMIFKCVAYNGLEAENSQRY